MPKVVVDGRTQGALKRIKACTEASLATLRLSIYERHNVLGVKAEGESNDIYSDMFKAESALLTIISSCDSILNPEEWEVWDGKYYGEPKHGWESTQEVVFGGTKLECESYMKEHTDPRYYMLKKEG